jgi:hypothetical protein
VRERGVQRVRALLIRRSPSIDSARIKARRPHSLRVGISSTSTPTKVVLAGALSVKRTPLASVEESEVPRDRGHEVLGPYDGSLLFEGRVAELFEGVLDRNDRRQRISEARKDRLRLARGGDCQQSSQDGDHAQALSRTGATSDHGPLLPSRGSRVV